MTPYTRRAVSSRSSVGGEIGSHGVVRVQFHKRIGDRCRADGTFGGLLRLPVAGAGLVELRLDQCVGSGRRDKQLAVCRLAGDDREQDLVRHGCAGALDECVPEAGIEQAVVERHAHGYDGQARYACVPQGRDGH